MAGDTKAIKEKIGTVGSLKKITRAMEMVARSKMKRAIDAAVAARPYTQYTLELLANLSEGEEGETKSHPLLTEGEGEKTIVIHVASDKGLCGGYNAQALRSLESFVSGVGAEDVHVVSVGRYAGRHAEKTGAFFLQSFNVSENVTPEEAQGVVDFILERFESGEYKRILISYTNFETVFSQKPIVRELLPISQESIKEVVETAGGEEDEVNLDENNMEELVKYKFEPSRDVVLETILPRLVSVQVYQALLEAQASEQSSRMVAMKNATDNAAKLGEELNLRYNRARQAGITNEIIEIAAGADAV